MEKGSIGVKILSILLNTAITLRPANYPREDMRPATCSYQSLLKKHSEMKEKMTWKEAQMFMLKEIVKN